MSACPADGVATYCAKIDLSAILQCMADLLRFATRLANSAGDIMYEHFETDITEEDKDDGTIVTVVDRKISTHCRTEISSEYPAHGLLCEESDRITSHPGQVVWVIDELDGTHMYAKGMNNCAFSIAAILDGVPLLGVVCEPLAVKRRVYTAVRDQQSYLNGKPLRVSSLPLNRRATIDVEWWPFAQPGYDLEPPMHQMSLDTQAYVLHGGSVISACMQVARGRSEGCVFAGTAGKFMDAAAVIPIIEGAGGRVTCLDGNPLTIDGSPINGMVASNGVVHDELLRYCRLRA